MYHVRTYICVYATYAYVYEAYVRTNESQTCIQKYDINPRYYLHTYVSSEISVSQATASIKMPSI
jgi:hypothetical protein